MSNGDMDIGRDGESSSEKNLRSSGDEFGRAVSRISVAQVCQSVGFQSSSYSALDALAEIMVRYVAALGRNAKFYADVAGRTSCNVFDVIQGLEDLSSTQGFGNAADAHHCLARSGVVRELAHFVSVEEEVPFGRSILNFPVPRIVKSGLSFCQAGELPPGNHVPDWLPKFPDSHTYVQTPLWSERNGNPEVYKVEQSRQRRKAERSLLSLQDRLARNDSAGFVSAVGDSVGNKKQVVKNNPFLAPPLPHGERQVSEIAVPNKVAAEKRLSVLETFAPAIEAANFGSNTSSENEKGGLAKDRLAVHFKIGVEKKLLTGSVFSNVPSSRKESWPLRENEKDEKKRRAEMILKEAMEKPHDLVQM